MPLVAYVTPRDVADDVLRKKLNELIGTVNLSDLNLEIPAGNVPGKTSVNKFGRGTNFDSGVLGDVWSRNNPTDTQPVWLAPTAARVHAIVSSSDADSDTGGSVAQGAGARTLRLYGLKTWDLAETSEDIILDGTSTVNTTNSYVIIHRMKVLTSGASGPNVGQITATAATDGTVTAQIQATKGQTEMAIYGIPSIQTAYMTTFYISIQSAPSGVSATMDMVANEFPGSDETVFITKHTDGLVADGTSRFLHQFQPYMKIAGPAIYKLQATANTNNSDRSGGFDLIIVNN